MLGDSFAYIGLEKLRPIFQNGRFLWVGHYYQEMINRSISRPTRS